MNRSWVKNQSSHKLLNHLTSFGKTDTLVVPITMVELQLLPVFLCSCFASLSLLFSVSKRVKLNQQANGQMLNLQTMNLQQLAVNNFQNMLDLSTISMLKTQKHQCKDSLKLSAKLKLKNHIWVHLRLQAKCISIQIQKVRQNLKNFATITLQIASKQHLKTTLSNI